MRSIATEFRNELVKKVNPEDKDLRVRNQALAGMHFMINNKFKYMANPKNGLPEEASKP